MQVTIKITKWRVVLAIIILILGSKFYKYARQPFMFELFGSQEAAQKYFDEKYPAGSGAMNSLARDIIRMNGICGLGIHEPGDYKYEDFEYNMKYACEYDNDYLSIDPFFYYRLIIYANNKNKIIKINIYRFSKEYFP